MPEIVASSGLRRIVFITYVVLSATLLILAVVLGLRYQYQTDASYEGNDALTDAVDTTPDMNYPTALLAEQAFISGYEWRHGVTEDTKLEQFLVTEATRACESLDVDHNVPRAWSKGVAHGMSSDQAATVIDLAIEVYCPKHKGDGDPEARL